MTIITYTEDTHQLTIQYQNKYILCATLKRKYPVHVINYTCTSSAALEHFAVETDQALFGIILATRP